MSDSLSSNTQLRFCLSDLEHKDLSEQAAASLSALLCSQVDEQHQVCNSNVSLLLKVVFVGSHKLSFSLGSVLDSGLYAYIVQG